MHYVCKPFYSDPIPVHNICTLHTYTFKQRKHMYTCTYYTNTVHTALMAHTHSMNIFYAIVTWEFMHILCMYVRICCVYSIYVLTYNTYVYTYCIHKWTHTHNTDLRTSTIRTYVRQYTTKTSTVFHMYIDIHVQCNLSKLNTLGIKEKVP